MVKSFILLSILLTAAFSQYDIKCPNDIIYNTGSGNIGVDYFYQDGDINTPQASWSDVFFEAFDSNSAVCGGSLDKNILLEFYCDYNTGKCYEHIKTSILNELHFITNYTDKEGKIISGLFTNKSIIVNGVPCVNSSISLPINIIHTYYNDDTTEKYIKSDFMGFKITGIFSKSETILDEDIAKKYRKTCNKTDIKEYVDELEPQRFQMPSYITSLNDFFDTDISFFNDIDITNDEYNNIKEPSEIDFTSDLSNFTSNYKESLDNSLSKYSDIFGFGGYGSAPSDIYFTFANEKIVFFSESHYADSIDTIRSTLLAFGYIVGSLLVLKGQTNV